MALRLSLLPFVALALILTGCYGRPAPEVNSTEVAVAAGIQLGKPGVVTFSALWCHPCREEIDSMNQASREFAGAIQFRGFLVEGEEKGSTVQQSDISQFISFTGEAPLYGMLMDPSWRVFDTLHAPQGHSLPTMVVIDRTGKAVQTIQQSLDYETQLRPLLVALTQGDNPPPVVVNPVTPPPPATPGQQQLTDSVANWVNRAEVVADPTLVKNVTQAWQSGLTKYAFTSVEMPLDSGQITFVWDGAKVNTPLTAAWTANTAVSICTLNLVLAPDGTLLSSSGNCRQK
jgi:thiol-disulfide isomerase/thioredoxin